MNSHQESGVPKRARSVTKPARGNTSAAAAKGNAGDKSVAARPGKAAKNASANPAKKSGRAKSGDRSKVKKDKLIRDGFTIPESEYDLIAAIKKRCLAKGMAVKKSEVLRAAIISFAALSDAAVTKALKGVEVLKTGRPPSTR
jgi:hypothetical protein